MEVPHIIRLGYSEQDAGLLRYIVETLTVRGFVRTPHGSIYRTDGRHYSRAQFRTYVRHLTLSRLAQIRAMPNIQPTARSNALLSKGEIIAGRAEDGLRLLAYLAAQRLPEIRLERR